MQWYAMVCNGMQWCAMVCNGVQWYAMVCSGSMQWYAVVCNVHVITSPPTHPQSVCSSSLLMQKCSLSCLKDVVKALAARRLATYRTVFFELTGRLFAYLMQLWTHHLQNSISQTSTEAVLESLQMASDSQKGTGGFPLLFS